MPDHIAHLLFARRVVQAAPQGVRARINPDAPLFRAGCFGPDPLFNDPRAAGRHEGHALHRCAGRESLERLRPIFAAGSSGAIDFTAGFFCHYALDRLCHPELIAMAARGEARHVAVETAYDRRLLQGGAVFPHRVALSADELQIAAAPYRDVTPAQYRIDLSLFWKLRGLMRAGGGTPLAPLLGRTVRVLDGVIPYKAPSEGIVRGMDALHRRIDASVLPAAEQLAALFAAFDAQLPLGEWFDASYAGA